jgi:hypothetical protein
MAGAEKRTKVAFDPRPLKKAIVAEPIIEDGHPLAWRFSDTDPEGPFAWAGLVDAKLREVIDKLAEFEGKPWNEITATGSHSIPTNALCKAARNRLVKIQKDDLDELLSLRLSGSNRVWCERRGHILRVLWWDGEHQVYPVEKDPGDRKKARRRKKIA